MRIFSLLACPHTSFLPLLGCPLFKTWHFLHHSPHPCFQLLPVVSSVKSDGQMLTLTASLLYFPFRPVSGSLLPGTHLKLNPTSMSSPSAVWILALSAILITAWWCTLKKTWGVGHPSLRPYSRCHSSLSPSLLTLAICRSLVEVLYCVEEFSFKAIPL